MTLNPSNFYYYYSLTLPRYGPSGIQRKPPAAQMKASASISMESNAVADAGRPTQFETPARKEHISRPKPAFRRAADDTKPVLQDPILRSDPIETEEAVLRLPPLPAALSSTQSNTG